MKKKENDAKTEFVKEEENPTQQFILQKNFKTKMAIINIAVFLVILVGGIVISGIFFGEAFYPAETIWKIKGESFSRDQWYAFLFC